MHRAARLSPLLVPRPVKRWMFVGSWSASGALPGASAPTEEKMGLQRAVCAEGPCGCLWEGHHPSLPTEALALEPQGAPLARVDPAAGLDEVTFPPCAVGVGAAEARGIPNRTDESRCK